MNMNKLKFLKDVISERTVPFLGLISEGLFRKSFVTVRVKRGVPYEREQCISNLSR